MHTLPFAQAPISLLQLASLRDVYLSRLERLVHLRSQHEQELNGRGIRLLDRSIFSAYYACRSNGIRSEAGQILQEARPFDGEQDGAPKPVDGLAQLPVGDSHPSPHKRAMNALPNDSAPEASP